MYQSLCHRPIRGLLYKYSTEFLGCRTYWRYNNACSGPMTKVNQKATALSFTTSVGSKTSTF